MPTGTDRTSARPSRAGQDVGRRRVVDDRDARSCGVRSPRGLRASGSSPGSVLVPAAGPRGTTAGFAPRNDGVVPITRPPASVTWTAT